jgi:hypothetical protein
MGDERGAVQTVELSIPDFEDSMIPGLVMSDSGIRD